MDCRLCQRVARALHPNGGFRVPKYYNTKNRRWVNLGSWKELRENEGCPTCLFIANFFVNETKNDVSDFEARDYQFWLLDIFEGKFISLTLQSNDQNSLPELGIYSLAKGSSYEFGVVMDQYWVDMKQVWEWIKCCDTTHGKCYCRVLHSRESFTCKDMYLIDLSQNSLVEAKGGEKYIALSYVWGTEQQPFRTSKANLTRRQSKEGLSRMKERLPGTIQRVMHFTSMLGLSFLWVDSLCIVQDDPIHKATQVGDMAAIYSNSYLTVCATDGIDSNSGLRGIPGCSQPRNVKQDVLTFKNGAMTSSWVMKLKHETSVYQGRAWAFQEYVLSCRRLSFTDRGLEWECQELISQEECPGTRKPVETYQRYGILHADILWPCLKKWDNLLSAYLDRKLTYEEDILHAFSGILETLGGSISGGFHFGLPEQFFDAALLWVPTETLIRREDPQNGYPKHEFPSWSWVGWKGNTESQINAFGLNHERSTIVHDYKPRKRDIFPQVTYYKIEQGDNNRGDLVRISNDYAKYLADGLEGDLTLPLGWSSHRDEADGPFYYRYDRAPPSQSFWYPIPTVRENQPGTRRQCYPCLFFITFRGYLEIASPLSEEEQNGSHYPLHHLYTANQEWAGVLYVHQPPVLDNGQTSRCELIVISVGFAFEDATEQADWIPEFNCAKRPRSGDYYLFYNVLWIEREGIDSYRKGVGRVVQKAWDNLPKDEVQIWLN